MNSVNIYYVNADDNQKGLTEKLEIAEQYGFHMLAPGHQGFKAANLIDILNELINLGLAAGTVIILDTVKKFTDPMSKSDGLKFWRAVRAFVSQGGTVISLSHTNKNPGSDGKPIYAGTSDSVDDADCAFTLRQIETNEAEQYRVVEFENFKNRGQVESKVSYRYSIKTGLNYRELLASVTKVDINPNATSSSSGSMQENSLIQIVEECITEGVNKKMALIDAVVEHSGTSKRKARALIEQYTGSDPVLHKWNFERGDRGAHIFKLLQPLNDTGESC
ncbi:MAG: hypothetical protein JKX87_02640 [Cycloclasticus sp.]|nr:hypothetical protein [Cycloclasticus sp.]